MSNTNKNTMYIIIVAVVVIVVVAVAGAYVLMNPGGGGETEPETVTTMKNATSLQYSVNFTAADGTTGLYKFSGKNLGTADLMLRIEIEGGDTDYFYILNAGNQTAWANVDGTWQDVSSGFNEQWNSWGTAWTGYVDYNPDWKAGDANIVYNDNAGNSITIYDITINPTLADSLFTPT